MRRTKSCSYLFLIFGIVFLSACTKKEATALTEINSQNEVIEDGGAAAPKESIMVYVCGEVNHPGVYELPAESRLFQAVEAAGGMAAEAADTYLNQARILSDGESIYVPNQEEAAAMESAAVSGQSENGSEPGEQKVNLNTAAKEELMTLTGIGEAKALSIIEYRNINGPFGSIEEIKNIPGIKDGVFQKIKDHITV